ncbi:MAG: electron transfer flavoprotein subunit alpha/FixB family protein [Bacteroidetes bacterium]|nr:electron transfer flavoprotein subunit alpha/FixB family protein [Bacteroidota bacterium]
MSIIVFAETTETGYKKSSLEAVTVAREIANRTQAGPVVAVVNGQASDAASLGNYGADEVLVLPGSATHSPDAAAAMLAELARNKNAATVIISNNYTGKSIAPAVATTLNASLATNVIDYPDTSAGYKVKRGVFSGKAFAWVELKQPVKVLAITPNSFEIRESGGSATVADAGVQVAGSRLQIQSVNKVTGKIPLTEAEIVVSGGRGMKGPENWGMIEDLAKALGAATACSKPVSDMGWRSHSEHVGQTGITIKPNLYIAIGISGAIQHLAGVSSSKVIVAINKDPEAPFFKAADYGIVGDAFEVLPKLIAAATATSH